MVKVAPSILSADFAAMGKAVENLEKWGADYVHCDVMDGRFVPNITFGMPMIKAIRKHTSLPLDVHLMIVNPEDYIEKFIDARADIITFHPDSTNKPAECLATVKNAGLKCGLVLNPDKPLSMLTDYLDIVDEVIVMGVYAGFGGQKFLPQTLDKISQLKKLAKGKNLLIEMDGGATCENARSIENAGADILVAGSAVFGAENPAEAIRILGGK